MKNFRLALALCAAAFTQTSTALHCPAGQEERCGPLGCICLPQQLIQTGTDAAGLALEQWLRVSRNASLATAQPLPPEIRQQLKGKVDDVTLDQARYKIDEDGALNLAGINLRYGYLAGNEVAAVTLIDVIVFRTAAAAADDSLWVHELHHVRQFRDWGVREFALRYARDYRQVEDPAYAAQERYRRMR